MEAVHGTLDRVVDRLAIIEKNIRDDRPKPADTPRPIFLSSRSRVQASIEPAIPCSRYQRRACRPIQHRKSPIPAGSELEPTQPASAEFSNLGLRPVSVAAIDPGLPADQPLEPGSGRPPLARYPGARIAASEAALGGLRPNTAARSQQVELHRRSPARRSGRGPRSQGPSGASAEFQTLATPKASRRAQSNDARQVVVPGGEHRRHHRRINPIREQHVRFRNFRYERRQVRDGRRPGYGKYAMSESADPECETTTSRRRPAEAPPVRQQLPRLMPMPPHLCWRPRRCLV